MCLESIRNEFMHLDGNLFVAKLKYLQRGDGCCKKKREKSLKIVYNENPLPLIFFCHIKWVFRSEITRGIRKKWSQCSTMTIFDINW